MNRALMRRRCPTATAAGMAQLTGWRLIITGDGYASIAPAPGHVVHGVLWRLMPRDWAALNAYESLDSGLYSRRLMAVSAGGRKISALAYVARDRGERRPVPGYLDIVIAAAREWQLPPTYVRALERWSPTRTRGLRAPDVGDIR